MYRNQNCSPSQSELINLRSVAQAKVKADLIITNTKVLHVHTGDITERDIVISGRHIAALTPPGHFEADRYYDAEGQYAVPNFIESHFHIEYSMLTPGELARLTVPKGTTTVLADPNCIANVLGKQGIEYIRQTDTPLRIFMQVSSSVPRTPELEQGGARLSTSEIEQLLQKPFAVSLGEAVPYDLSEDSALLLATALREGKRTTGHTARMSGEPLWAYIAGGIHDDHNCATSEEVMELLRLGCSIAVQSGSMSNYIADILSSVKKLGLGTSHIFFSADDKHVLDLKSEGHIDHHVRQAIECGLEPALAIRMASLNAAAHFRIDHLLGSITPSRLADLMLLPNLTEIKPSAVFVDGKIVAKNGEALFENKDFTPEYFRKTINIANVENIDLKINLTETDSALVSILELYDGYYKRHREMVLPVEDDEIKQDPSKDISKIAVVDRHLGSGKAGVALIYGSGLREGAIASSNNCENQNIVVIGTSDEDMLHAIATLREMGGGYCIVSKGKIISKLELPIAGIMTDENWESVAGKLEEINQEAINIGCRIPAPFLTMAFIGLAGVPDYGLSELGLIDVKTQKFVDIICSDEQAHVNNAKEGD